MRTQNARILAWLKRGRSITSIEALRRFGCLRLAARCHELTRSGHQIVSERVTRHGKRYARYRLA